MSFFSKIRELFCNPSALQLKSRQLYEAEVSLLEHQTQLEYYEATVPMLKKRIKRLQEEISSVQKETEK